MPNILILLNSFWNNGAGMSGGDQIILQTYLRNQNSFNKIYCVTNHDGQSIFKKQLKNISFLVTRKNWDKLNLLINYLLRTLFGLKILLIKDISTIHSSSDFLPDVLPGFFYKIFYPKTKWLANIMHIYPDWRKRPGNKFYNFIAFNMQKISFLLLKKADLIITLNKLVKDELIIRGFNKNKIKIIPAGIDFNYFHDLKVENNTEHFEASFLARLKPSKGIFDLINVWKKVAEKLPKALLCIIGGGGDDKTINSLKELIKINKLENNIKLLGYLNDKESFSLIKNSSLFLFPSHEEGFGIVIAEAMACGVAVITWDLEVYNEIFENKIIKIKENDGSLMAKKIVDLLGNKQELKLLSNSGKDYVKKFSWDSVAQKYMEVLL